MQHQFTWPANYSLEGAMKRILYLSSRPLNIEELTAEVESNYPVPELRSREPLQVRIHKALTASNSSFERIGEGWGLAGSTPEPLHDETFKLLQELGVPVKQGEILRLLQMRTHRSKGELMSRLNLESDWRFARLEDGDWTLTEWNLNDMQQTTGREETVSMNQLDLVAAITTELEGYIGSLVQRQNEIPQEVVSAFQAEDLKTIEHLMQEKKRIEGFSNDLRDLMRKWSESKELQEA